MKLTLVRKSGKCHCHLWDEINWQLFPVHLLFPVYCCVLRCYSGRDNHNCRAIKYNVYIICFRRDIFTIVYLLIVCSSLKCSQCSRLSGLIVSGIWKAIVTWLLHHSSDPSPAQWPINMPVLLVLSRIRAAHVSKQNLSNSKSYSHFISNSES